MDRILYQKYEFGGSKKGSERIAPSESEGNKFYDTFFGATAPNSSSGLLGATGRVNQNPKNSKNRRTRYESAIHFPGNVDELEPTRRQIIGYYLNESYIGRKWDQLDAFFNMVLCVAYFYYAHKLSKYNETISLHCLVFDFITSMILFFIFLPRYYVCPDLYDFILSPYSIISTVSTLTPLFILISIYFDPSILTNTVLSSGIFIYLYPLRFVRLQFSIRRVVDSTKTRAMADPVNRHSAEALVIVLTTVTAITVITHVVLFKQGYAKHAETVGFFDVFFFTAISSVTGLSSKVNPDGLFTQLISIFIMFLGIFWLPSRMQKVLGLIKNRSPWESSYTPEKNSRHVIVIGDLSYGSLEEFLREFYCLDHGSKVINTFLVLMSENPPNDNVNNLINLPRYLNCVRFVLASPTSGNDLKAVCAEKASSIFILTGKNSDSGSLKEESKKVMICLAIKKYLLSKSAEVPIFVQASRPETSLNLSFMSKNVLCVPELRSGLIALGTSIPGFASMLVCLVTTISDNILDGITKIAIDEKKSAFYDEYIDGLGQEIYTTKFSPFFRGMKFNLAAQYIYKKYSCILFAIKVNPDYVNGKSKIPITGAADEVFLNPSDYVLTGLETGYMINSDKSVSEEIAQLTDYNFSIPESDYGECDSFMNGKPINMAPSSSSRIKKGAKKPNKGTSNISSGTGKSLRFSINSENSDSTIMDDQKNKPLSSVDSQKTPLVPDNESKKAAIEYLETNKTSLMQASNSSNSSLKAEDNDQFFDTSSMKQASESVAPPEIKSTEKAGNASSTEDSSSVNSSNAADQDIKKKIEKITDNIAFESSGSLLEVALMKKNNKDGSESKPKFKNHVVVCISDSSFPGSMEYLVGSIRKCPNSSFEASKQKNADGYTKNSSDKEAEVQNDIFPNMVPILFLCQSPPGDSEKKILEDFGNVYFISGSPEHKPDLVKANIMEASKAIVLLSSFSGNQESVSVLSEDTDISMVTSDSSSLISVLNIEYLTTNNKDLFVFIELNNRENMSFIGAKSEFELDEGYIQTFFRPCFMAGNAFAPVVIDTLIGQCFYNNDLIAILKNLIFSCGDITEDVELSKMISSGLDESHIPKILTSVPSDLDSNVYMIDVPKRFVGKPFSDLFLYLCFAYKGLCLGLYRNSVSVARQLDPTKKYREIEITEQKIESLESSENVSYFLANPSPDTILNSEDKIYYLSNEDPVEIL
ncbi:Calcium-activated potassium channel slowpoke [Smittium culicis]|uniref:Calcium-activated potassium channel slowpoke n=1 Tax=Smittium culicis TaxID=133412 RepID=A0A1R1XR30_9FUNG|nr:Calcium-activated potassium channel slowpoke [Smittium culicis]OMJ17103.1 Calcium-activated potassium channel slowpoke [Smittium culicis]